MRVPSSEIQSWLAFTVSCDLASLFILLLAHSDQNSKGFDDCDVIIHVKCHEKHNNNKHLSIKYIH